MIAVTSRFVSSVFVFPSLSSAVRKTTKHPQKAEKARPVFDDDFLQAELDTNDCTAALFSNLSVDDPYCFGSNLQNNSSRESAI
jgi:hypothetical protein